MSLGDTLDPMASLGDGLLCTRVPQDDENVEIRASCLLFLW